MQPCLDLLHSILQKICLCRFHQYDQNTKPIPLEGAQEPPVVKLLQLELTKTEPQHLRGQFDVRFIFIKYSQPFLFHHPVHDTNK